MRGVVKMNIAKKVAYGVLVLGCFMDQFTTRFLLPRSSVLFEANANVRYLIEHRLWLLGDITVMLGIFLFVEFVTWKFPKYELPTLVTPFLAGTLKGLAGVHNIFLYIFSISGVV